MCGQAEMPKYKCHKEVWALKIAVVDQLEQGGARLVWLDPKWEPITVDADYVSRHAPQAGGYYVVYADGYKSYSPADAFEQGYTLIHK